MKADKLLLPALNGTLLMTLFSYIVSGSEGKNFSEPELLAALEKEAFPEGAKKLALPAGWITHYTVGVLFTFLYEYLWQNTSIKPTVKSGAILGGLSGIAGVLSWKLAFKAHPAPPRTDYRKFYNQLLIAHIIFGMFVALTRKETGKQ